MIKYFGAMFPKNTFIVRAEHNSYGINPLLSCLRLLNLSSGGLPGVFKQMKQNIWINQRE